MTPGTDAADFLGQGWPFPVRPDPFSGSLPWTGGEDKVQQSIMLILGTAPGERPMRPDFGCGVHELVFQANSVAFHGVVAERVRTALVRWEPRIDVLSVAVESPTEMRNVLLARIEYRIRANNAAGNLVYPFYLNEGQGASG